jgi:hypothetical protein
LDPHVDPTELTQPTPLPPQRKTHPTKREAHKKTERATCSKRQIHDEDAVRVDEEGMHSDTDSLVALSDSSYDTDLAASSDSDFDSEYDPDVHDYFSVQRFMKALSKQWHPKNNGHVLILATNWRRLNWGGNLGGQECLGSKALMSLAKRKKENVVSAMS